MENLEKIFINGVDYYHGEQRWYEETERLLTLDSSSSMYNVKKYAEHIRESGFIPVEKKIKVKPGTQMSNISLVSAKNTKK